MADYSKYKERKPEDTVFEIRRILNGIGLFPVVQWLDKSYEGARSNRVTLYPTTVGTNGKGTDELYCTASGFAELIERMNNGLLFQRDRLDDLSEELGFREYPDEKDLTISEILSNPDPLTERVFSSVGADSFLSRLAFLNTFAEQYGPDNKTIPAVPFTDPATGSICYLPYLLVLGVAGSNGMAAGNTLTEAIVQGLSEVFERAVSHELLLARAVPPEIPDEELKKYSFYHLIEEVRAQGKYRVTLYDCSLGKGWPVAGICVNNLETGKFGMKLGAHPSFAVACERTLTEALQGRNMEQFSSICIAGTREEASEHNNYMNVSKTGNGIYPATMFTGKPGWEFRPWTEWEGLDNKGFLKGMLRLLKQEGLRPLIRDTSFLGFPSCFIVVPGFSELFLMGKTQVHMMNTSKKVLSYWSRFPDLEREEEERMLRLIRYRESSVLENMIGMFSMRPLSDRYQLDRIGAWLSLKLGDFRTSAHYFHKLEKKEEIDTDERIYYNALVRYAKTRQNGLPAQEASRLIIKLYREDVSRRVCEDTADEQGVMQKMFTRLSCFDCENCRAAESGDCQYPVHRRIIVQIYRAMKAENVNQEKLLKELCEQYW